MKNRNRNRIICTLAVLSLLLPLLTGCSREQAAAAPEQPPPPAVTVSAPLQKSVTRYAEFTGTTEALESVTVRARVEGFLDDIHFTPGAYVEKGELLYSIDARPYETELEQAEANLAIRRAEMKLAKTTKNRREKAYKDHAVSEVSVIEARAQFKTGEANIAAAEAAVKKAELDLSYTRITAPISGRIGRSLADAGNLVGAGERTALTTIVQDDSVYAYFTVSERDLLRYQREFSTQPSPAALNTPVFLSLSRETGYPFQGHIDYLDNRVDTETGTLRVRAVFPNPDHRLMPGLFARVRVPLGNAADALLVPETALGRDQQGYFLLTADSENTVQYKPVTVGVLLEDMRVISGGISPDDRVIVNGLQKARPGTPVTPVDGEEEPSAETHRNAAAPEA